MKDRQLRLLDGPRALWSYDCVGVTMVRMSNLVVASWRVQQRVVATVVEGKERDVRHVEVRAMVVEERASVSHNAKEATHA